MSLAALLLIAVPQTTEAPPVARAPYVAPDVLVIDGDPSEWRGPGPADVVIDRLIQFIALAGREPAELWTGPEDASVRLWVGWNEEDLVLAGEVWDEVTDHDLERWFHGDSLELFLNLEDREPEWGSDDYQVMLAPNWRDRPWGVYPHSGQTRGGPLASDAGFGGVEITCHPFEAGYRFEARIPWRNFGDWSPSSGDELPFNLAVCDRDGALGERGRPLHSYGTWTGERDIAIVADRRGTLVLEGGRSTGPDGREGVDAGGRSGLRPLLLVLLAGTYGLALLTRRVWRAARARRLGVAGVFGILALAVGIVGSARLSKQSEIDQRRAGLERYASSFEDLLRSGALGHPEPTALVEEVQMLLAGEGIAPVPPQRFDHLQPEGARHLSRERTTRRGIPYVPFSSGAEEEGRGRVLRAGESCILPLPRAARVEAVHLVTRVSDRRFLDVREERPVLSVELSREGVALVSREVRHRQDLHHEEDEHRDHPGLEPAFDLAEGRLGSAHGDALLLELDEPVDVDRVVVRHLGPGYDVRVVAVGLRLVSEVGDPPEGLQLNADGEWEWSDWRQEVEAEVVPWNRTPKLSEAGRVRSLIRLGTFPVGSVSLLDTSPLARPTRWDFLPLLALAATAPFLVAIFAEWLATRRRIRDKLAVGFAVSSAVPLLALTLLLEASLTEAHESGESERAQSALLAAERELEETERELERGARRLLRITELERAARGAFPSGDAELESWWGAPEGALRLLEHVDPGGRRERVGSGPGWSEVPASFELRSGLIRPWGRLLVAGVARTPSGAERPLAVLVARTPRLPDSTGGVDQVRLIGAGRDPAPTVADLTSAHLREIRRPIFGPDREELAGVLVVSQRERGVPVLGDFTLNELLLAAGLTALVTALLFAGILTGHIVGPIERLDRAVREGTSSEVEPAVPDEMGHLTAAIRSFTIELSQRVSQLETLQRAQSELSSRLDFERAREAVLAFFREQTGAASAWLAWAGGRGEEPRLLGEEGRDLPVPEESGFFAEALTAGEVLRRGPGELPGGEAERVLLGPVEQVLSLPLLAAGECRGAIVLGLRSADLPVDLAFLGAASGQAAIVLENARLYHQAVSDAVTGFLSDPGFRQRLTEEIRRAQERAGAGVLLVQARLTDLPEDDETAAIRMREAARRMRLAVPGLAIFGRAGSSDLKVAIPWGESAPPSFEAVERRIAGRLTSGPWPDGEPVRGLHTSHAVWPADGPSGRFVTHVLEERLVEVQSSAPLRSALAGVLPRDFVAESPILIELLDTVRRIAEQEATVLVSGETGVGKDRIAELIHAWSPRASGPLVHVHCPSLSEALIEDELFGHEVGAFTGAHSRRVGPFEYAAGGTVVLDEIGGLSPEGQVALLRLLETREVLPLGATTPIPLDVRVVVTTSRDLTVDAERGDFRRDLYFRLNVAQVTVPPLRLRRPDIPALVEAAVRRFNATSARPVTKVDPRVLDVLFDHPWPGNLRELDNVLSRALITAAGGELEPEHLTLEPEEHAPGEGPSLNPRQEALLSELAVGARISSTEHADRVGVSSRTALRDLVELVGHGLLAREGLKRGTRFRRLERPRKATSGQ